MENGEYHRVEALTAKWPSNAKPAIEVAAKIGVPVDRLIDLADSGYMPHYRIDGGPPLFILTEVQAWFARNKIARCEGQDFPISLRAVFEGPIAAAPIPKELSEIENLRDVTELVSLCSGVYFLCYANRVVYVGQSKTIGSRISSHFANKEFDRVYFLPWPRADLDRMEGAFIRLLRPVLNGKTAPLCDDPSAVAALVQKIPSAPPLPELPHPIEIVE